MVVMNDFKLNLTWKGDAIVHALRIWKINEYYLCHLSYNSRKFQLRLSFYDNQASRNDNRYEAYNKNNYFIKFDFSDISIKKVRLTSYYC